LTNRLIISLSSLGWCLLIYGFTWGNFAIFLGEWQLFSVTTATLLSTGIGLILICRRLPTYHLIFPLFTLYICSAARNGNFTYYYGWSNTTYSVFFSIATSLTLFLINFKKPLTAWSLLLALTATAGLAALIFQSHGSFLSNDDHTSFIFRLMLLKENFPFIPFYNPLWNGGYDAREFLASGVLNFYLLFYPFIQLFDIQSIYTILVGLLLFLILPLNVGYSTWLISKNKLAAVFAAILAIGNSTIWYKWAFTYGTIGFITTASFLPLSLAIIIKFIESSSSSILLRISLIVVTTLALLWPLGGLVLLPVAFFGLPLFFDSKKRVTTIVTLTSLVLVNSLWITLFFVSSPIMGVIESTSMTTPNNSAEKKTLPTVSANSVLEKSVSQFSTTNLVLVGLLLPGLASIPSLLARRVFSTTIAWLLFLGLIVSQLKPRLELERMLLIAALLGSVPAGVAAGTVLRSALSPTKNILRSAATALLCLIMGSIPWWIVRLINNQSTEKIAFAGPVTHDLAQAIVTHGGEGRILFAGFTLHDVDGGHVAMLPQLTGKPFVAAGYYHDEWRYHDIIPRSFLARKRVGIEEYHTLMNVSAVITHEPFWRKWYTKRKKFYELVSKVDKFTVFKRKAFNPSYFVEGNGSVTAATNNSVTLRMLTPSATLKFKHYWFLEAPPCTIGSKNIGESLDFVHISNCPIGTLVTLRSISPFQRVVKVFNQT
jgi:hypothetical protein